MLKSIFGKKDAPIKNYGDFWEWFLKNERSFFKVVKKGNNIEKDFFGKLSPKLEELKDGFFFLAGMEDENTAELILTADGAVKNMVFVEELVYAAPKIQGWKFTTLKQALDIENVLINMGGYKFDKDNLFFYSNDYPDFPDEIDISVVYQDFNEEDKSLIANGAYIFLDNYLGELNFATTIDNLTFIGKDDAQKELIPIVKLKDFLIWRQKEFIGKYEGLRYNTEKDSYSSMEAELNNGKPLIAIVNSTLLDWDSKASHPWILSIEIKYDGEGNNGLPNNEIYQLLNKIEDEIMEELKDSEGYLNIGRQAADGVRVIFFACKDFRKPSKVLHQQSKNYADKIHISFDIYKDKYWQSFNRFRVH